MTAKKFCSLFMAGWMLIGALTGCGTPPGVSDVPGMEESDTQTVMTDPAMILTNVYNEEEFIAPDGVVSSHFLGIQNGCYTFQRSKKVERDDGTTVRIPGYLSVPIDGGEHTITWLDAEVDVELGNFFITFFQDVCLLTCTKGLDNDTMQDLISLYVFNSGELLLSSEDIASFSASIQAPVRDAEGYIYVLDLWSYSVSVITPDFSEIIPIQSNYQIFDLAQDSKGNVYAQFYVNNSEMGTGEILVPIDPESRKLGEVTMAPCHITDNSNGAEALFFDKEDQLYARTDKGIYRWNPEESSYEMLMDFENSMINGENVRDTFAVGEDRFLIEYLDEHYYYALSGLTRMQVVTSFYTPGEDIDLTKTPRLELAVLEEKYSLQQWITSFNKTSGGVRVVTRDYYQLNTAEDPQAGSKQLAFEIINGLYTPDMVYGNHTDIGYMTILENDLFVDLKTFMETDTILPLSDLLGSVQKAYSKDGKIYALPTALGMDAVLVNREMVGDIDGWTAVEMMEFIRNLPEGTEFMKGLTRSNVVEKLFGKIGYASFIDYENATCSFTDQAFLYLLEYIKSLPEKSSVSRSEDHFGPYRTGKYAAVQLDYEKLQQFFYERTYFGEGGTSYVGYPTATGENGIVLSGSNSFIILAGSKHPEHCWNFLRNTVLTSSKEFAMGIPVLRSMLQTQLQNQIGRHYSVNLNGRGSGVSGTMPDPPEPDRIYYTFSEADAEYIYEILDTVGVSLISSKVPDDVTAIINEELSAYLGSDKSAEACADMIQSRVSIYLAEHN